MFYQCLSIKMMVFYADKSVLQCGLA